MQLMEHFMLLARYNQWMNTKVYAAASHLPTEEQWKDRGAFFGSILGTLNHIMVGDILWLKRFATHPSSHASLHGIVSLAMPSSLEQILIDEFEPLHQRRKWMDEQIINWIEQLSYRDLDDSLSYHNIQGTPATQPYSSLILHFFNHQTHHRGQVSTLLLQAGEDIGSTDLLDLIAQQQ
ncbi:DinB family protein [Halomonas binhaiensis]|uniref:DinB family protein n=1 Tax=Halomonas binhaiensis TaxID=2562282 RepID=A0A5C1NGT2_9GAMM|nr:DinB family protein [Halomonas binhaiensis]QEM82912.1 DinB family protein [Halomonas binhaiensis]